MAVALSAQSPAPDFAKTLYPALEKAQCRACHTDEGVSSTTRLQFPPSDATPAEIAAFGLRLRELVNREAPGESPLLTKPTNRVRHTGGERIKQGGPEEQALEGWVRYLAGLDEGQYRVALASHDVPARRIYTGVVRRLTHSQYNHTVRDLLGDQTRPANQFPQEDYIHGFKNMAEGQSVPPLLAEAYTLAAERLATNAFRGDGRRKLVHCTPGEAKDAACAERFVREFGAKAFRRPLGDLEVSKYRGILLDEAGRQSDFYAGAQLVVEAMLQSPHFLMHAEQGPGGEWEHYRAASRLSYFLWDTMPDEELFRLAAEKKLGTKDEIEKAARRMLADPRARASFEEFLAQWMRFDRALTTIRDRRFYRDFSSELAAAMVEETKALFNHLVWEDRDFREFFTARYSFINADLARIYGLPEPPEDFARVDFPEGYERAGILGQGLFLTLTSKPSDTSPTERGLFVREHFLCQNVPPPPPGLNASLPPVTDAKPMTNRQRLDVHLTSEMCSGCHRLVDPIGFGFEKYDAVGRFRDVHLVRIPPTREEQQSKKKTEATEYRLPIDTTGSVLGLPGSDFRTPAELGRVLADAPTCQKCIVKLLFRYALGREQTTGDEATVEALLARFRESGFRLQQLILGIISTEQFLGGPS